VKPELLKGRRGETRLVALVAEEDHVPIDISAEGRISVPGRRVKTPLEDVSRHEMRVGDDAVALTLSLGPDVDQHRSGGDCVTCRDGIEPLQPTAGRGEQLIDRHPGTAFGHGAMNVSAFVTVVWLRGARGVVSARGGFRGRRGVHGVGTASGRRSDAGRAARRLAGRSNAITHGELVDTYAHSTFEDSRRKAAKFGAMGSTVRATKPALNG
jgi:hypothetical protein